MRNGYRVQPFAHVGDDGIIRLHERDVVAFRGIKPEIHLPPVALDV